MIVLNSVSKIYHIKDGMISILEPSYLSIQEGDFTAIMGPSGSGKSTLMNIIGGLDKPTSGTYNLLGEDISNYREDDLARIRNQKIGFVFQQFHLLPRLSALENVELPMIYSGIGKKERIRRAHEALRKVGLEERIEYRPDALSGGQKQRVAIARAIVNQPKLLLADEPTGALDTKTGKSIMNLFTSLNREETTIVLVTHEPEIAEYAKKVINVRDGKIQNQS